MRNKNSRIPDFNSFRTSSGDSHRVQFSPRFNADGTIELKESGRVDIQAEINSHLAETDIALIISRLEMGDTSVVNRKPVFYGDFTQFPKSYAEMLTLVQAAEDAFMSLSPEIRAKYNNDKNQWFAQVGTDAWLADMGLSPVKTPVDEPLVAPSDFPVKKEVHNDV